MENNANKKLNERKQNLKNLQDNKFIAYFLFFLYFYLSVVESILDASKKEKIQWFESYVENMTDEQVADILSKYLEDNPGRCTMDFIFSCTPQ